MTEDYLAPIMLFVVGPALIALVLWTFRNLTADGPNGAWPCGGDW